MHENWKQVKEILGFALERNPEERLDFVRQACGEDERLREEVESLLSHHNGADSLLENPPAVPLYSFPAATIAGTRIGAYRVLSETGQGGMAVVYLAERADDEYQRRVAIKIVKPGANREEIIRRFRNERQTLAALDHPHIVKLLDGGTTEQGWPYLVMDFVDGVPIDEYCRQRQLAIRGRLELFRTICSAVAYAHSHKVIHRDLKPGNILITPDGVVRLLDFGIAKVLDPDYAHATLTTGDRRPMTPEYASPEQISGQPITSASDIYSLGVLLYELLTGNRPHHGSSASWSEIQRMICEEEPIKPSDAVGATDLRRSLQGDLDIIVMMALRKEPERRYGSAEELSKDIERYLSSMPITARRPTLAYRGGKFFRRHKEAATAVTLMAALFVGVLLWQAFRISKEKTATAATTRSSVAVLGFKNVSGRSETAWLSTALSEMLTTELASGGKLRLIPGETVARAKVDLRLPESDSFSSETLKSISQNLNGEYVVTGSYLDLAAGGGNTIRLDLRLQDAVRGETVAALSETGSEDGLLDLVSRSGADLRRRLGVADVSPSDTVKVRASSPANAEAMRLYAQGLEKQRTFDDLNARDLLTRAIAADPSFPLAHSALAQTWRNLGYDTNSAQEAKKAFDLGKQLSREDYLLIEARYNEAALNWEKAIDTYRSLSNVFSDNLDYGLALASAQTRAGKGKDALKTLEALPQSNVAAKDDPRIDLGTSEAASSLDDDKLRRDAGERAAAKAGRQGARLLAARADVQACRALANLGENDRAKVVCEEGRRIYEEAGDRGGLARILHSTAEVPLNQDDLVTAEQLYRQELLITREIGDKRGMARSLVNLALIYKARNDWATAQKMNEDSLQNYADTDDQSGVALVSNNQGNLLRSQGKLTEALKYYRRSLDAATRVNAKGNEALAMSNIAESLVEQGNFPEASKMFPQILAIYQSLGRKRYYANTLVMSGQMVAQQGNLDQARKDYTEALSLFEQLKERGGAAETRDALAELECDSGKAVEAEALARNALDAFRQLKQPDGQSRADAVLSRSLVQQGKLEEARKTVEAGLSVSDRSPNIITRLTGYLANARVLAASKDPAAERTANELLLEARRFGLVQFQLEASVLLGEIKKDSNRLDEVSRLAHN